VRHDRRSALDGEIRMEANLPTAIRIDQHSATEFVVVEGASRPGPQAGAIVVRGRAVLAAARFRKKIPGLDSSVPAALVYALRAHILAGWLSGICILAQPAAQNVHSLPSSRAVKVRTEACISVTAEQRRWLSQEWDRFLPFVHSCEVRRENSAPIYVLSIWVREFEATLPDGAAAQPTPKPIVASKDGKILAHLPEGFPEDPPRSSQISFSNWVDGFPRQIEIRVDDPAVLGNRTIHLDWDTELETYMTRKSSRSEAKK
jgi:hypothetical protein